PINGSHHAVCVCSVVERFEDLKLIAPHEDDAAIAPVLTRSCHVGRNGVLQMQLHVAETFSRRQVTPLSFEITIADSPGGWRFGAIRSTIHPLRQVLAIEKNNGIG